MVSVFFCTDIMSDAKVCYSREFNTWYFITSQVVLVVKSTRANAGDVRDMGLTPGLGRSPREGHSNPLQNSCLEDPMDRGVWQATAQRATKSQTWLKWISMHPTDIAGKIHIVCCYLSDCLQGLQCRWAEAVCVLFLREVFHHRERIYIFCESL